MGEPHGNRGSKHAAKRVQQPHAQRSPHFDEALAKDKLTAKSAKMTASSKNDSGTQGSVDSLTSAERQLLKLFVFLEKFKTMQRKTRCSDAALKRFIAQVLKGEFKG